MCTVFLGCFDLDIKLTLVDELRASGISRCASKKFVFHGLLRRHRYGIGGGRSNHRLGGGWRRSQPDSNPRQQQQQHNYRHPQHHWRYHHYHHHYHHHLQRHHPADRNGG